MTNAHHVLYHSTVFFSYYSIFIHLLVDSFTYSLTHSLMQAHMNAGMLPDKHSLSHIHIFTCAHTVAQHNITRLTEGFACCSSSKQALVMSIIAICMDIILGDIGCLISTTSGYKNQWYLYVVCACAYMCVANCMYVCTCMCVWLYLVDRKRWHYSSMKPM